MGRCSYCRSHSHNARNCPVLNQDVETMRTDLQQRWDNTTDRGRQNIRVLEPDACRELLKRRRIQENKDVVRRQRRQEREEWQRRQREAMRLNYERQREQRERRSNLIVTAVEQYVSGLDPSSSLMDDIREAVRFNNYNYTAVQSVLKRTVCQPVPVKKVETPIEATECPICFDEFSKTDKIVTSCGHQFHSSCVFKHLQRVNTCPCCREVLF